MRKRKGALLRISIEIETTKKSLFYLLAQSVSVYPTSNVGTLVRRHTRSEWRFGNLKPKHQEIAMDSGRVPQRVFSHRPDEITQTTIDLWPPCPLSKISAPECFQASAMPSQDGRWLHPPGSNRADWAKSA